MDTIDQPRPETGERRSLACFRDRAALVNFQVAYDLAKLGFAVFPCQIEGKHIKAPLRGLPWTGALTENPEALVRLWARLGYAAPAIDCGRSGLVIVDPDVKHDKQGVAAGSGLVAIHGPVASPIIETPSGGLHVYFRQPQSAPVIRCSRGDLPPGIDVKGAGGYVLAPGAVIEAGTYRLVWGNLLAIPEVPLWLMGYLLRPRSRLVLSLDRQPSTSPTSALRGL